MGRFLIETHLRTGRPIKELAAAHDVSARWLFKLLRRYRLEGAAGLEPRSRRPKTVRPASPISTRTRSWPCTRRWPTMGSMPVRPPSTFTWRSAPPDPLRSRRSFGCSRPGGSSPSHPRSVRRARSRGSCRPAERDLAGRHDPRGVRGRPGLRGAQHDRRPLEAVRGVSSHEGGQGQRRRPRPPQSGRELGIPGLLPQRQRAHLLHPAPPPGGRGHRTRRSSPSASRPSTPGPTTHRPVERSSASTRP